MLDKQQLLRMLRDEYERWQTLLAGLDEAQLSARTLPAGLSIKDVIAHLHAWQEISIARLEAAAAGRQPALPAWTGGLDPDAEQNLEQINAAIHATYCDQPWPAVYAAWRTGCLHYLDLAEAMAQDDLFDAQRYAWLGGRPLAGVLYGSYEHHHEEHYGPLTAWLQQQNEQGTGAG